MLQRFKTSARSAFTFESVVENGLWILVGLGIIAIGASTLHAYERLKWPWLLLLVCGVALLVGGAAWRDHRDRLLDKREQYQRFLQHLGGLHRRYGSNLQPLPRERRPPTDWRTELMQEGKRHLDFLLGEAANNPYGTSSLPYLNYRDVIAKWCAAMFQFASARGVDHTQFRDFPPAFGRADSLEEVRAIVEHNILALERIPPQTTPTTSTSAPT